MRALGHGVESAGSPELLIGAGVAVVALGAAAAWWLLRRRRAHGP